VGVVEWLLSPAAVIGAVGLLGICAVLLTVRGLAHRDREERRLTAHPRRGNRKLPPASRPPPPRHSRARGRGTFARWRKR